jgi:hypothetical protein
MEGQLPCAVVLVDGAFSVQAHVPNAADDAYELQAPDVSEQFLLGGYDHQTAGGAAEQSVTASTP